MFCVCVLLLFYFVVHSRLKLVLVVNANLFFAVALFNRWCHFEERFQCVRFVRQIELIIRTCDEKCWNVRQTDFGHLLWYLLTTIFRIGEYLRRQRVSWLLIADRRTFVRCILLHEFLFGFLARLGDVNHFIRDVFTVEDHQDALLPLLNLLTITKIPTRMNIHTFISIIRFATSNDIVYKQLALYIELALFRNTWLAHRLVQCICVTYQPTAKRIKQNWFTQENCEEKKIVVSCVNGKHTHTHNTYGSIEWFVWTAKDEMRRKNQKNEIKINILRLKIDTAEHTNDEAEKEKKQMA